MINTIKDRLYRIRSDIANKIKWLEQAERIIQVVCEFYKVDANDLASSTRQKEVVKARYTISNLIRRETGLTIADTGEIINKDHSTISYYLRVYRDELEVSRRYRNEIEQIKTMI